MRCSLVFVFVMVLTVSSTSPTVAQLPAPLRMAEAMEDITWPSEWTGEWEIVFSDMDCSGVFTGTRMTTRLWCVGDTFEPEPNAVCEGLITPDALSFQCTYTIFEGGTCIRSVRWGGNMSRDGDILTGSGFESFGISNCTPQEECNQFDITGVRISPPDAQCAGTPVEEVTWSRIKALYGEPSTN